MYSNISFGEDFFLGVGTHLGRDYYDSNSVNALMRFSGVNSFRDEFSWARVEKKKGVYRIERSYARLDSKIQDSKFAPVVILAYSNKHYSNRSKPLTPVDREAFSRYAKFIVSKYNKDVLAFEIWNEWWHKTIGNVRFTPNSTSPKSYIDLVKVVVPQIKKINPQAIVLCGGVSVQHFSWLKEAFEYGLLDYCDVSLHPYMHSFKGLAGGPKAVFQFVDDVWLEMQSYRRGADRKIYITEIGWPIYNGKFGRNEKTVNDFLAQTLFLAKSRPYVNGLWWYDLIDDGVDAYEMQHSFGLVTNTMKAKLTFKTFGRLSELIIHSRFHSTKNYKNGIIQVNVVFNGKNMSAVWSPKREVLIHPYLGVDGFLELAVPANNLSAIPVNSYPKIFQCTFECSLDNTLN